MVAIVNYQESIINSSRNTTLHTNERGKLLADLGGGFPCLALIKDGFFNLDKLRPPIIVEHFPYLSLIFKDQIRKKFSGSGIFQDLILN